MKRLLLVMFFIGIYSDIFSDADVDKIKGIGTSIWSTMKSIPDEFVSFWKDIELMGQAPDDYNYQYLIFNDTNQPVWVGIQVMRSMMGAVFPQANSWSTTKVDAYSKYPTAATIAISESVSGSGKKAVKKSLGIVTNYAKEHYYFEMFIKTTDRDYPNHMPYQEHTDVIYQLDKLDLSPSEENTNYCDIFRIYMGKDLANGKYVHSLKSEKVGAIAASSTPYKYAISIDSKVNTINIKNSTTEDYYVGFYPQASVTKATSQRSTSISPGQCIFLGLVEKNSFGLLSAVGSIQSFQSGLIAIYSSKTSKSAIATLAVPAYSFNSIPYTLEIYQDEGQSGISCHWQGIMPGHYDMPTGRIKDITPIIGAFWYQSVAQVNQDAKQSGQSSGHDLPGYIWIVSYEENSKTSKILGQASPGQYVQFQIERAVIGDKKKIYFLYSTIADSSKINLFIQNLRSGKIGSSVMSAYESKLDSVMNSASGPKAISNEKKDKMSGSAITTIINEIALNTMQMNRGQIIDKDSGVTAFVLGTDVFMPVGIGAGALYYVLTPSLLDSVPTNSVQNYMGSVPKGLPTTSVTNKYAPTTYSIAASK
jgi:hypothetical protein